MVRIAVVNQHLHDAVGGSELQCDLVARGLVSRGHEVVHLAVQVGGPVSPDAGRAPFPASLPYRVRRVARSAEAIATACIDEQVDVVYWRFNRPLLQPVAKQLAVGRIPLVLAVAHVDDIAKWPVRPLPRGGLRPLLSELRSRVGERRSWSAFRDVAAVASQRHDFLGSVPVIEQRPVRNLMSSEFVPYDHPRPYVAWVGSVQQRKRPDLLPAIAEAVAPLGLDLLVVGQIREPRFRLLLESGPPNLRHLGLLPLAETIGLIAGARLLVVTAEEEGFANVLIQAWWYGTPTVSLRHDPDALIATHDLGASCGGDEAMLLWRAVELIEEPGSAAGDRRARIQGFARDIFASDRTLDALEGLLHDVVARR